MIVFDLQCGAGHPFEGWFGSSGDFAEQQGRGLVTCPVCGSAQVAKAAMAPNLGRKGNQREPRRAVPVPAAGSTNLPPALAPEAVEALRAIAAAQAEALKASQWVGPQFADKARAMHYGEEDAAPIHGEASADEARALIEEGVEIAPVLFPVVPPGQAH